MLTPSSSPLTESLLSNKFLNIQYLIQIVNVSSSSSIENSPIATEENNLKKKLITFIFCFLFIYIKFREELIQKKGTLKRKVLFINIIIYLIIYEIY